jgi:hypothetical protein
MRRTLLAFLVLVAAGCSVTPPDKKELIPWFELRIVSAGDYRLEGRSFGRRELDQELSRLASENRDQQLGRARLFLRIIPGDGVDWNEVTEVINRAGKSGIDQIETAR